MKVLMIIPAYNEEQNIVSTVNSVRNYSNKEANYELDYIVINDGSTDGTKEVCAANGIKCISLIQNLGIGGAVQTGYIYANIKGYDVAVQFDGDGQHDINSLDRLLKPILEGTADFVVGSRFVDKSSEFQSTALRRIGINWLSGMIRIMFKKKITDPTSGFRAGNKAIISMFATHYPVDYPEPESVVVLLKNSFRVEEVQVNMFERKSGTSSINIWKSVYYMFKVSIAMVCAKFQKK